MKYGVFISYSHKDAKLVSPIVQLIRSMRSDLVFQDTLSIKPGKPWESQLGDALQQSDVVIVFWCSHSKNSSEVKKEYEKAILENKDVLPVLLDGSELPEEIAKYQWIDLRTVIQHHRSSMLKKIALSIAVLIPIIFAVMVWMINSGSNSSPDTSYANTNPSNGSASKNDSNLNASPIDSFNLPYPDDGSINAAPGMSNSNNDSSIGSGGNYDSNLSASPIDSFYQPYPDKGSYTVKYDNSSGDLFIWVLIILAVAALLIPWWLFKRNRSKKKKRQLSTSIVADKLYQQLNDKLPRVSK